MKLEQSLLVRLKLKVFSMRPGRVDHEQGCEVGAGRQQEFTKESPSIRLLSLGGRKTGVQRLLVI